MRYKIDPHDTNSRRVRKVVSFICRVARHTAYVNSFPLDGGTYSHHSGGL